MIKTVQICETFISIQGESTWSGMLCFFIRLAGCNLRCSYCDTPGAHDQGETRSIESLVEEAIASAAPTIQITGGEPLMQEGFIPLTEALCKNTMNTILVETNGSMDISIIPDSITAILDVKCPNSGEGDSFLRNLVYIRITPQIRNCGCVPACDGNQIGLTFDFGHHPTETNCGFAL